MPLHVAEDPRTPPIGSVDDVVQRRAVALMQHQRVMDEAARIARVGAQERNRLAATPVFASQAEYPDSVRSRVQWDRAS